MWHRLVGGATAACPLGSPDPMLSLPLHATATCWLDLWGGRGDVAFIGWLACWPASKEDLGERFEADIGPEFWGESTWGSVACVALQIF